MNTFENILSAPDEEGEELTVEQLFTLCVANGILSAEEAERLAGEDLDGDFEWWETGDDDETSAAGGSPYMMRAIRETLKLRGDSDDVPTAYKPEGQTLYETLVSKAMYKSKHLSTTGSGNMVYDYASTGSGKVDAPGAPSSGTSSDGVKRTDNKQTITSSAGQRHEGHVKTTGMDPHHDVRVKIGGKSHRVRPKNSGEAKKVGKLIASGRIKKG